MKKFLLIAVAAGLIAACAAPQKLDVKPAPAAPLIPRADLFGNPEKAGPQISPDGKYLSWLAPVNGVLNVWVAPTGDPPAAKSVTHDKVRGIRNYFWAYDNHHVVYLQDVGGNENFHAYSVNISTLAERDLSPLKDVRAEIAEVSYKFPKEILVGINNRGDHSLHDLYRVNVVSGKRKLLEKNPGFAAYVMDDDYRVRFAVRPDPDGGTTYLQRDAKGEWKPFLAVDMEDSLTTQVSGFNANGDTLYLIDSRKRDTAALTTVDLKTGAQTLVFENPKADVEAVYTHPTTHELEAVVSTYDRKQITVLDASLQADLEALHKLGDGELDLLSATLDNQRWIVGFNQSDKSYRNYLYDRATHQAQFLFATRPWLEGKTLARMVPRVIKARDGLPLVNYLSLPPGSDPDGDGVPEHPLPLVLDVHGGPWARDEWSYNGEHQWLANRGYAVLSVNYRGSTGFGKKFLNAGNLEWAGKMHDDLLDAVHWAVKNGIADEDKVAIYGGSYGGYATLVGLTFTPKTFACGVDIVGPSNLNTLLASIPPYWKPFFEQFAKRTGDPRTEAGKKLLDERSPLTRAADIERPLLIGQGANDPRVHQAEADQIVKAMQDKHIPVTYVLYSDEGHGFARPENRRSFYAVSEAFLGRCLGGRVEPPGKDFEGSSMQVKVGAEYVPGLAEALGARSAAQR